MPHGDRMLKFPTRSTDELTMGPPQALLSGRVTRRTMNLLVLAVLLVSPIEAIAYDHPIGYATLPVRDGLLVAVLVGLNSGRIGPIVAGRLFLAQGLAQMVGWSILVPSEPSRIALEAVAYGAILSIFALMIAPRNQRRYWSMGVLGVCIAPAAARLVPDELALFGQVVAVLVVHTAAVALLDSHANNAERAGEMASIDPLTGLLNRRPVLERIEKRIASCASGEGTSSLVLLDLDRFKELNDTLGHDAGDAALVRVADTLITMIRPADSVCRWGGEEFLLLLPNTDQMAALEIAERLRAGISHGGVTASFGVAEVLPTDTSTTWVRRADLAMYDAKRLGRNRVSNSVAPVGSSDDRCVEAPSPFAHRSH